MSKQFYASTEFVSSGHPDRLCDNLAAIVINDIQKKDGVNSHAAIEVFATHDSIIFAGEAITTLTLDEEYLRSVVHSGFIRSGYLPAMRAFWTKDQVVLPEDIQIINKICPQSPDIALGTTDKGEDSGYNDQGIFFSSADNTTPEHVGIGMKIATQIGEELQQYSQSSIIHPEEYPVILGPDNKVVVTIRTQEDGMTPDQITAITVAASHSEGSSVDRVTEVVKIIAQGVIDKNGLTIDDKEMVWTINGTGRFVVHGQVSDTSMTGRKISVNHPSAGPVWMSKNIGGGSSIKHIHASDLILNIASRVISNIVVTAGLSTYAVVGTAGAIGQTNLQSLFIKGDEKYESDPWLGKVVEEFFFETWKWSPVALARKFGFFEDSFDFGKAVNKNFFGNPSTQPWECPNFIAFEAEKLKNYLKENCSK